MSPKRRAAAPAERLPREAALESLHELRLLGQLVVDLPAQLAAHDAIGDGRRQDHGHADRERGRHGHAPPQRHQPSFST